MQWTVPTRNIANNNEMLDVYKRMQAHKNDPNYLKTKQGKADLKKPMFLRKQVDGNITNGSSQSK